MSDSETEVLLIEFFGPSNQSSMSESTSSSASDSIPMNFPDNDDEPRRKHSRIENYVEITVKGYDNKMFKSHFRISKNTTSELIGLFEQSNFNPKYSPGRPNVSSEKAVLLTLWYLANRNSFREVSDRFGVSLSFAHHCLKRVLKFVMSVKNQYICWPYQEQMIHNADAFSKNGIPGAIGAIDGSHIEVQKPKENQDSYLNRKGFHSLLLQGVVDHNKRFIDIFCGEPGSLHDARLLRDFFLLGDSAYPNLDWIITPFSDTGFLSEEQKLFDKRLSSKRVVVENAFGLLKGRFRRLKGLENFDFRLCSEIIFGSCILHNICQNDRINAIEDIEENDENQPPTLPFRNNLVLQDQLRERNNR